MNGIESALTDGFDDWLYVSSMGKCFSNLPHGERRRRTLDLIRDLLAKGLVVAVDVDDGFVPWGLSAPDSLARIERE